jgi:hypothetical protein
MSVNVRRRITTYPYLHADNQIIDDQPPCQTRKTHVTIVVLYLLITLRLCSWQTKDTGWDVSPRNTSHWRMRRRKTWNWVVQPSTLNKPREGWVGRWAYARRVLTNNYELRFWRAGFHVCGHLQTVFLVLGAVQFTLTKLTNLKPTLVLSCSQIIKTQQTGYVSIVST